MGCDIHTHIEVKINGKWEHWGTPNIHRSYILFEKMAGVRGSIENAISSPKGLPADITSITKIDRESWGIDGHSDSWLSSDEIEDQLYPWFEKKAERKEFFFLMHIQRPILVISLVMSGPEKMLKTME